MRADSGLHDADGIVVYGRDTCEDTQRARWYLEHMGIQYRYVNLDLDADARARVQASGHRATPVIVTPLGAIAMEPSDERLAELAAEARP